MGHGGTAADLRRGELSFTDDCSENGLFMQFGEQECTPCPFPPLRSAISAWWFNAGFNECFNVGGPAGSPLKLTPHVWTGSSATGSGQLVPCMSFLGSPPLQGAGILWNPFADEPLPDPWITEEEFSEHLMHVGPHSQRNCHVDDSTSAPVPRVIPAGWKTWDMKDMIDQYDCGVRYTERQYSADSGLAEEKRPLWG